MAMIAMTTSNSMSVNPPRGGRMVDINLSICPIKIVPLLENRQRPAPPRRT
jgi:hypothetical protein